MIQITDTHAYLHHTHTHTTIPMCVRTHTRAHTQEVARQQEAPFSSIQKNQMLITHIFKKNYNID